MFLFHDLTFYPATIFSLVYCFDVLFTFLVLPFHFVYLFTFGCAFLLMARENLFTCQVFTSLTFETILTVLPFRALTVCIVTLLHFSLLCLFTSLGLYVTGLF
jgi:hypothetical protein